MKHRKLGIGVPKDYEVHDEQVIAEGMKVARRIAKAIDVSEMVQEVRRCAEAVLIVLRQDMMTFHELQTGTRSRKRMLMLVLKLLREQHVIFYRRKSEKYGLV